MQPKVSAFLTSLAVVENPADYEAYEAAVDTIIKLLPEVVQSGIFEHMRLRSDKAITLITDLYPELAGMIR